MYFPVWALAYAPLAVVAAALSVTRAVLKAALRQKLVMMIYIALLLLGVEISFLHDVKWFGLLVEYFVGSGFLVIIHMAFTRGHVQTPVAGAGEPREREA